MEQTLEQQIESIYQNYINKDKEVLAEHIGQLITPLLKEEIKNKLLELSVQFACELYMALLKPVTHPD